MEKDYKLRLRKAVSRAGGQVAVAEKLGISQQAVSGQLNRAKLPLFVVELAKVAGVSLEWLLAGIEAKDDGKQQKVDKGQLLDSQFGRINVKLLGQILDVAAGDDFWRSLPTEQQVERIVRAYIHFSARHPRRLAKAQVLDFVKRTAA